MNRLASLVSLFFFSQRFSAKIYCHFLHNACILLCNTFQFSLTVYFHVRMHWFALRCMQIIHTFSFSFVRLHSCDYILFLYSNSLFQCKSFFAVRDEIKFKLVSFFSLPIMMQQWKSSFSANLFLVEFQNRFLQFALNFTIISRVIFHLPPENVFSPIVCAVMIVYDVKWL